MPKPRPLSHPVAERNATVQVDPASAHPMLDPTVRSFLDRWEEQLPGVLEAKPAAADATRPAPDCILVRPVRASAPLPLFLYLTALAGQDGLRTPALQMVADRAGIAVLELGIAPEIDDAELRALLRIRVAALSAEPGITLRADCLAIGGDGPGAALALRLALSGAEYRLLVMATPVLDRPFDIAGDAWLPPARAAAMADAAPAISPARIAAGSALLPPTLILTAEADPFRNGAEALGRKLLAQDVEVSVIRFLGTIHDFTWLPPLRDAPASVAASQLVAGALRQRLHSPAWQQAG